MANKPPGYCVECFKVLHGDEIICGACQDDCDGRWDHLRQIKEESLKESSNVKKKND